jgi:alkane 1-monooxygenase
MNPYKYLSLLFLPALAVAGYYAGGFWNLLTPACCFLLHPLVSIITKRKHPVQMEQPNESAERHAFRVVALCFLPALVLLFCWSLIQASRLHGYDLICFSVAVGTVNGVIGFTLAHEFIHRHSKTERTGGLILLLINNYLHYEVEHIGGHHLYACTGKDPHTAHRGESFYHFLPRAIGGTYRNAWEIEIRKIRSRSLAFFHYKNRMLLYTAVQIAWWLLIFRLTGTGGLVFFFVQSAVAICLLHMINYLQHYGLMRRETADGKTERIAASHAWSSGQSQQEFNLFQVENHADHHMHPSHAYDQLVHHDESPRLPGGYTTMMCVALFPPVWFRLIHKRIPLTQNTHDHEINH